MADFNIAIKDVFSPRNEGSTFSNVSSDLGGATKYGVSKRFYPQVDIVNLTEEQAAKIWKDSFWTPNRLEEINDQEIANKLLNMIGNSNTAIKQIQIALLKLGVRVKVDGVIGSATITAINSSNPIALLALFKLERIEYYLNIVDSKPDQLANLKGWTRRVLL